MATSFSACFVLHIAIQPYYLPTCFLWFSCGYTPSFALDTVLRIAVTLLVNARRGAVERRPGAFTTWPGCVSHICSDRGGRLLRIRLVLAEKAPFTSSGAFTRCFGTRSSVLVSW